MNSLNIGVSGLLAFQRQIDVTSHNIANVATDGYSRQRAELTPASAQFLSGSYHGNGVEVATVRRAYDGFVNAELWGQTATQKSLQTVADLSTRLGAPLADASSSLQGALSDYYAALRTVAAAPQDASARQAALSSMQTLATRVRILDGTFGSLEQEINGRISATVGEISAIARQIADVNGRIASAGTAPPNDLLDNRDRLITQLAGKIAVQTVAQPDGTLNVLVGTGQALVNGTQAFTLSVGGGAYDAARPEIYFSSSSGTGSVTEQMSGGELGGQLGHHGLRVVVASTDDVEGQPGFAQPDEIGVLSGIQPAGTVRPLDRIDAVIAILPSMKSPTVNELFGSQGYAIETVVVPAYRRLQHARRLSATPKAPVPRDEVEGHIAAVNALGKAVFGDGAHRGRPGLPLLKYNAGFEHTSKGEKGMTVMTPRTTRWTRKV